MQDLRDRSAQGPTPTPTGRTERIAAPICTCRPALIVWPPPTELAHAADCGAGR